MWWVRWEHLELAWPTGQALGLCGGGAPAGVAGPATRTELSRPDRGKSGEWFRVPFCL